MRSLVRILGLAVALLVGACAPHFATPGLAVTTPRFDAPRELIARDGRVLPVERWGPKKPRAVIIALHGMNDYANAFADPAAAFAKSGIVTIAYDQRGFGRMPPVGRWAGEKAMVDDLDDAVQAVRRQYPKTPIYVLGESMGAAVVILWAEETGAHGVDGIILSAPAIWGWHMLNPLYRTVLSLSARILPGKTLSGSRLKIWPSDNIKMLRALYYDPLVIKETRTDTIYGLVTLMDDAYVSAPKMPDVPILILYGAHDQIIPPRPLRKAMTARLDTPVRHTRFVYYPHGYHMLLRDLGRATVTGDIRAWVENSTAALPSGDEDDSLNHLSRD